MELGTGLRPWGMPAVEASLEEVMVEKVCGAYVEHQFLDARTESNCPPPTETRREKSVADLLNPSSPPTGSKRKHSRLSDITPEEKSQEEEEATHESPEKMDETDDDVEEEDKMESMDKVSTQELAMLFPGKNVQALKYEMETITLEPALPTPNGASDGEVDIRAGEEEEERPRKRARAMRPKKQFAKFAATALAGAIVGGAGMFAALVASTP
ncbi:hypothetical protein HOY80DRAFT_1042280 [Tuber brumale]|nr:hypothetical protein HOY80DRAFT_1042280 [Tuber brumale]